MKSVPSGMDRTIPPKFQCRGRTLIFLFVTKITAYWRHIKVNMLQVSVSVIVIRSQSLLFLLANEYSLSGANVFLSLSNQSLTLQQQNNVVDDAMNILLTHIYNQIRSSGFFIWIVNTSKSFYLPAPSPCINALSIRFFLPISIATH